MKYKSIAISGNIATGTTTTAQEVAKKLNLNFYSAGDFFREYFIKHNIPLYDKAQIPDEMDKDMDNELTKEAENGGIVIDAHYLGYFTRNMPQILKVLLTCDYKTRIKRALARHHTHKETEEDIKRREVEMDKKFRKLYSNEDYLNTEFFDLVINTTKTSLDEVVSEIVNEYNHPQG